MKRKICVVTGSRAEYGLLYWLMKEIDSDPGLQLQVISTGMHHSPEFGLTYREIEAGGFTIDAKVEILLSSDSGVGVAKSIGVGVIGFADALARLTPDIVVLLGDRFEILAAAQAAMVLRLPIAHIHGGEATEGLVDEAIRHAITKIAHIHFTASAPYRQRVIQMGESPALVFDFGAIGLDNLARLEPMSRLELETALSCALPPLPIILGTYHPVTLEAGDSASALGELFRALDHFPQTRVVLTKANADMGGRFINEQIDAYAAANPARVSVFVNLGQRRYLSLLILASVVVGNSSSGIIEAPAAGVPTVNIGDRQRGRIRAPSIIDCAPSATEIARALERALTPEFRAIATRADSSYGRGGASRRIKDTLRDLSLQDILFKKFYDLPPR